MVPALAENDQDAVVVLLLSSGVLRALKPPREYEECFTPDLVLGPRTHFTRDCFLFFIVSLCK